MLDSIELLSLRLGNKDSNKHSRKKKLLRKNVENKFKLEGYLGDYIVTGKDSNKFQDEYVRY